MTQQSVRVLTLYATTLGACLANGCGRSRSSSVAAPAVSPSAAAEQRCDLAALRSIELQRRNWENRGTDVTIDSSGAYRVTKVQLGRREQTGGGSLTQSQIADLLEQLRNSDFCSARNMLQPPAEEDDSWTVYQLSVRGDRGARTIQFDNRHRAVSESLLTAVAVLLRLTGQQ